MLIYLLLLASVGYLVGFACYAMGGREPFLAFLPWFGMGVNLSLGGLVAFIATGA
jgi:hypothetical protein